MENSHTLVQNLHDYYIHQIIKTSKNYSLSQINLHQYTNENITETIPPPLLFCPFPYG